MARHAFGVQLPLDDNLRRDAGMIGARLPQRVKAAHPVIANQRVHNRLLKTVPHMERAGDVRRRQQNAEAVFFGLGRIQTGAKITGRFPLWIPAVFYFGGIKAFGERHILLANVSQQKSGL